MKIIYNMTYLFLALGLLVSACSSPQVSKVPVDRGTTLDPAKVLIVYLSRTNNTKAIAEIIHQNTGGTLAEIQLQQPYPENYKATVEQVADENERGYLPPLKTRIDSIGKYDVIFIGFPTWGMKLPPPMKSFLKQYDLAGKTVVPFNSNGGYGIGSSFETVRELCPNSTVLEGFTTRGGSERDGQLLVIKDGKAKVVESDVKQWLQTIGIKK